MVSHEHADRDDVLEETAIQLEYLAARIRQMKIGGRRPSPGGIGGDGSPPPGSTATGGSRGSRRSRRSNRLAAGDRVRIIIRGEYRGRTGVITGKKSEMYWFVRLDADDRGESRIIYKAESSMVKVDE